MLLLLMTILATPPAATPQQQLARTLHQYRSATVSRIRLGGPAVVLRDSGATYLQAISEISSAPVGPDWVRRAVAVILDEGRFDPQAECSTECWPCDSAAHLEAQIEFGAGRTATTVVVLFRPRCAEVLSASGPVGAVTLGPMAGDLFDLIKEALPEDAALQAMKFPPRDPKAIERPILAPAEFGTDTTKHRLPASGDHVDVDDLPIVIKKVNPIYPQLARDAEVDGAVIVRALVDVDGKVVDTVVARSIPMLDAAAVAAVRQWKFRPATYRGVLVAAWVDLPVKFVLH